MRAKSKTQERACLKELLEQRSFTTWGEVKETAAANKTLCDYDGHLPRDLRQRVRAARRLLGVRPVKIRLDRTARGFHMVIIWSTEFSHYETVAVQAILGSDPMRELLNLSRARSMAAGGGRGLAAGKFWNILYSRKFPFEVP